MRIRRYQVQKWIVNTIFFTLLIFFYKLHQTTFEPTNIKVFSDETRGTLPTLSDSTEDNVNACFLILTRNRELYGIMKSIRQLEDRFNKRHNYPYVMLNDVPFTEEFKKEVQKVTNSKIEFGLVPKEHWSYPPFINQTLAASLRVKNKYAYDYGGSESYRFMCRFFSGFFFHHELTLKYDYYWRVEPDVRFSCDIIEDPFRRLVNNNASYGFTMSLTELPGTIPTLWSSTREWMRTSTYGQQIPKDNAMRFVSSTLGLTYNLCHFWSNFEIGSFKLWRSEAYQDYFNFLESKGGFFYERWGDAPVHSIYASLALKPSEIIYFENIGYFHAGLEHCPRNPTMHKNCHCNAKNDYNSQPFSCVNRWKSLGY